MGVTLIGLSIGEAASLMLLPLSVGFIGNVSDTPIRGGHALVSHALY